MTAGSEKLLIVGGGLTGSLIALALTRLRPDADFLLIEQAGYFGGGPIGPFFRAAVPVDGDWLIEPLIVAEWPSYYVGFEGLSLDLASPVAHLVQEQIHAEIVQSVPPERYRMGVAAIGGNERAVQLGNGELIEAALVIDARGDFPATDPGTHGNHVLNRLVHFAEPHTLDRPILVDATIRTRVWAYLQYLPLAPDLMLIRYVGGADGAAAPSPTNESALSEGGRVVREFLTFEPYPSPDPRPAGACPGWIRASSASGTLWHPTLTSPVACAARIAMEIGHRRWPDPTLLAGAMARMEATALERSGQLTGLIAALSSRQIGDRVSALRRLYGLDPQSITRFDTETSSREDHARIEDKVRRPAWLS
jgi:lycopene beta-cyclase